MFATMLSRYAFAGLAAFSTLFSLGSAQTLRTVRDFGDNPTDLTMKIYVPNNVADNPAVILAVIHSMLLTSLLD